MKQARRLTSQERKIIERFNSSLKPGDDCQARWRQNGRQRQSIAKVLEVFDRSIRVQAKGMFLNLPKAGERSYQRFHLGCCVLPIDFRVK